MKALFVRCAFAALALCSMAAHAQPATPQFKDYPAEAPYTGPRHELVIDGEFAKTFRTRLRNALASDKLDFAGRYVVVRWGCGSGGCNMGAVVDASTGRATPFPMVLSGVWPLKPEFDEEPGQELIYKSSSRLMVFAGDLGVESPDGGKADTVSFYELADGKFRHLKSVPYGRRAVETKKR